MTYSYQVSDAYNVFGAGHNYVLSLYKGDRRVRRWFYDSLFPGASARLRRRIRKVEEIYGATRRSA